MDRITRTTLLLSLAFAGLYAWGMCCPQPLWGVSHLAYLPAGASAVFGFLFAGTLAAGHKLKAPPLEMPALPKAQVVVPLGLALGMATLVYSFPLVSDSYGDALSFRKNIDFSIEKWNPILLEEVLYLNPFDTKIGSGSFYAFVNLTGYLTGSNGIEALYLLEAILMGLFTWIWLRWVMRRTADRFWQVAMGAAGLCSPIVLIFTGHFETYAFSLTAFLGFLSLMDRHFANPSSRSMLWLCLSWLICLKFHFISHLLLPGLGLAALWWLGRKHPRIQQLFTWKYALRLLLLPAVLGLLLIYLIPFGGWDIPRNFSIDTLNEAFFLPVVNPEPAPLDRYNLLSGAHLLDYLNMIFLWAPGALFAGLALLLSGKASTDWKSPSLIAFAALMVVFGTVFFLLNPLLTMPVDWDLLSLPAPVFMGLVLVLVGQSKDPGRLRMAAAGTLAVALLAWSFWWLHQSRTGISQRYIDTGKWGFKTYWLGTSTQILQGVGMNKGPAAQQEALEPVLVELEAYAHEGDDVEYAGLLLKMGKLHLPGQDFASALTWLLQAEHYRADLVELSYLLVNSLFMESRYEEAVARCPRLVGQRYPSKSKALRMAVHTCIEAGNSAEALKYTDQLLKNEPGDSFFLKVQDALRNGKPTSELRSWFRQN